MNKHLLHCLMLPEDDANRQIVDGFLLAISSGASHQFRCLEPAGGWRNTLDEFEAVHRKVMAQLPKRLMILVIDFDGRHGERMEEARARIPAELADRVFVLGSRQDPETLKRELRKTFEAIGMELAQDCHEGTAAVWGKESLQHNAVEVRRLRTALEPMLRPSPV